MWLIEEHESWPDLSAGRSARRGLGASDPPFVVSRSRGGLSGSRLIVLVHGLGGDRVSTWGDLPRWLYEDLGFEDVDIGLFGYRSGHKRLFRLDTAGFTDNAQLLADAIRNGDYTEVILVGHSLGGLVCKQAIRHLNELAAHEQLNRVKGLILLAAPALGTRRSLRLFGFLNRDANVLAVHSAITTDIQTFWNANVASATPRIVLPTFGAHALHDKLVSETSSLLGIPTPNTTTVAASHTSICKPEQRNEPVYMWVRDKSLTSLVGRSFSDLDLIDLTEHELIDLTEQELAAVRTEGSRPPQTARGGSDDSAGADGGGSDGGRPAPRPRPPATELEAAVRGVPRGGARSRLALGVGGAAAILLLLLLVASRSFLGDSESSDFAAEPVPTTGDTQPADDPATDPGDTTTDPGDTQPADDPATDPGDTTTGDTTTGDTTTDQDEVLGAVAYGVYIDFEGATSSELSALDLATLEDILSGAENDARDWSIFVEFPGATGNPQLDGQRILAICEALGAECGRASIVATETSGDGPFLPTTGAETTVLLIVAISMVAAGVMVCDLARRQQELVATGLVRVVRR